MNVSFSPFLFRKSMNIFPGKDTKKEGSGKHFGNFLRNFIPN